MSIPPITYTGLRQLAANHALPSQQVTLVDALKFTPAVAPPNRWARLVGLAASDRQASEAVRKRRELVAQVRKVVNQEYSQPERTALLRRISATQALGVGDLLFGRNRGESLDPKALAGALLALSAAVDRHETALQPWFQNRRERADKPLEVEELRPFCHAAFVSAVEEPDVLERASFRDFTCQTSGQTELRPEIRARLLEEFNRRCAQAERLGRGSLTPRQVGVEMEDLLAASGLRPALPEAVPAPSYGEIRALASQGEGAGAAGALRLPQPRERLPARWRAWLGHFSRNPNSVYAQALRERRAYAADVAALRRSLVGIRHALASEYNQAQRAQVIAQAGGERTQAMRQVLESRFPRWLSDTTLVRGLQGLSASVSEYQTIGRSVIERSSPGRPTFRGPALPRAAYGAISEALHDGAVLALAQAQGQTVGRGAALEVAPALRHAVLRDFNLRWTDAASASDGALTRDDLTALVGRTLAEYQIQPATAERPAETEALVVHLHPAPPYDRKHGQA